MFRMEVWVNKNIDENSIKELEKYLSKELGCEKVNVRDIIIK